MKMTKSLSCICVLCVYLMQKHKLTFCFHLQSIQQSIVSLLSYALQGILQSNCTFSAILLIVFHLLQRQTQICNRRSVCSPIWRHNLFQFTPIIIYIFVHLFSLPPCYAHFYYLENHSAVWNYLHFFAFNLNSTFSNILCENACWITFSY